MSDTHTQTDRHVKVEQYSDGAESAKREKGLIPIDTWQAGCGLAAAADIRGLVEGQLSLFVSAISPPTLGQERETQANSG